MKYVQFVLLSKLQTLWTEAMYTKMGSTCTTLIWGPCNHCCSGKAISITHSECVCNLSHSACNAHVPYCHLRPVWLHNIFPHYLTNGMILKTVIEHKMCFDFIYNFCLKHFSFYKETGEISSKIYIGLHIKYLSLLSNFEETWISSKDCPKILTYKISWKSVQWKQVCSMWTGWQTDMTKQAAFHNFAHGAKNV